MKKRVPLIVFCLGMITQMAAAQTNDSKLGGWYIYAMNTKFNDSEWGFKGDIQYRDWSVLGDKQHILFRGGINYQPQGEKINFTLGVTHITPGHNADGRSTVRENLTYQDFIFPVKFGQRFYMSHRFRFEQRFIEHQDPRTRYRYFTGLNIPLKGITLDSNTFYLALFQETFINGQQDIGDNRTVGYFDRARVYAGLGYVISKAVKAQIGIMKQTTNVVSKNHLQVNVSHKL